MWLWNLGQFHIIAFFQIGAQLFRFIFLNSKKSSKFYIKIPKNWSFGVNISSIVLVFFLSFLFFFYFIPAVQAHEKDQRDNSLAWDTDCADPAQWRAGKAGQLTPNSFHQGFKVSRWVWVWTHLFWYLQNKLTTKWLLFSLFNIE